MKRSALAEYTGREISARIKEADRRRGFELNWAHMAANYGPGVDAQLLSEQILLCDETKDLLYEAPDPTRYVKGTRPTLERYAAAIGEGTASDTERAVAVMRFTRDLYKKHKGWHPFFGGTEEVLIEKGEELCECVSRLAVALLEIMGIPARLITHTVGGHVTAEAYADGKWGYIDPRCGMYFLLPDKRLASLQELIDDPSILDDQPEEVVADVSPRFAYDKRIDALREKYLTDKEVNTFKYYSLLDSERYDYSWQTDEKCIAIDMNRICTAYGDMRSEVMGTPPRAVPSYSIRFTLPEGVTLSDDVLLGVRMNGVMCHPRTARFYLDGELIYSTDGTVPISEISTHQHGVIFLGGAGGSLPVSRLEDGEHKLYVEMVVSPELVASSTLGFFVKKK